MFQFSLHLSIFDRVANLKKKKSKEERKYVGTFFQPALRKTKRKERERVVEARESVAIRIVPDAIGLLIKGISCRASGSWAENLFHRVLMSAEKRYQGGGDRGGRLRSVDRREKRIGAIMLLRIDFLISRILNYFQG